MSFSKVDSKIVCRQQKEGRWEWREGVGREKYCFKKDGGRGEGKASYTGVLLLIQVIPGDTETVLYWGWGGSSSPPVHRGKPPSSLGGREKPHMLFRLL